MINILNKIDILYNVKILYKEKSYIVGCISNLYGYLIGIYVVDCTPTQTEEILTEFNKNYSAEILEITLNDYNILKEQINKK
jgi:hypothetical protein